MNKKIMVLLLTAVTASSMVQAWHHGGGWGWGGGYYGRPYGYYDDGYYGRGYAGDAVLATGSIIGGALAGRSNEPKPAEYYDNKDKENRRRSINKQIESLNKEINRLEKKNGDPKLIEKKRKEQAELRSTLSDIS